MKRSLALLLAVTAVTSLIWWWARTVEPGPFPVVSPVVASGLPTIETPPPTPAIDDGVPAAPSAFASLSGVARFESSGEPAAGVTVWIIHDFITDERHSATADSEGHYTIGGLTLPERGVDLFIQVNAEIAGWHAKYTGPEFRLHPGESRTDADVTLFENRASISGTVMARKTLFFPEKLGGIFNRIYERNDLSVWEEVGGEVATPLRGVTIRLSPSIRLGTRDPVAMEAISDDAGRFEFPFLAPGEYRVRAVPPLDAVQMSVEKNASAGHLVKLEGVDQEANIELSVSLDDVSVTGRVTDMAGAPIAGASVMITTMALDDEGAPVTPSKTVVTGEDGTYRIDGLGTKGDFGAFNFLASDSGSSPSPGYYRLSVDEDEYAPAEKVVFALRHADVSLAEAIYAEAVRASDSIPELRDEIPESIRPGPPLTKDDVLTEVDFVLIRSSSVAGIVQDLRGAAVPDTRIRLVVLLPESGQSPPPFTQRVPEIDWMESDSAGQFRFERVSAATYLFEVDNGAGPLKAKNDPLVVDIGKEYKDIIVVVETPDNRGNLVGKITSADTGKPVANLEASVQPLGEDRVEVADRRVYGQIDDTGLVRIEGILAGHAVLSLHAEGYAFREIPTEIRPGETTTLDVALHPEALIYGYVSRNGGPAGHGSISVPGIGQVHSQADETGYYEFKQLPAGTHLLRYQIWLYEDERGGCAAYEARWVTTNNAERTRMDVDYDGSAVIQGSFDGPDDLDWSVRLEDGSMAGDDKLRASCWKFKANGRYEFIDVPAGAYTLVATAYGDADTVIEESREISVGEGEELTVNFDLR